MKIIVQIEPDAAEQAESNNLNEQTNQYEVAIEIYSYFLHEIFEKQFELFVQKKLAKHVLN